MHNLITIWWSWIFTNAALLIPCQDRLFLYQNFKLWNGWVVRKIKTLPTLPDLFFANSSFAVINSWQILEKNLVFQTNFGNKIFANYESIYKFL